jgi:hypothetical protein
MMRDMRIGYNAPYNEDCELRDNVIVNGELSITRYNKAVQQGNFIVKKNEACPKGVKAVLLPNRYDPNRAHLVIYNWDKAESVEFTAKPFLRSGEAFRLMDPKDFLGKPIFKGKCEGDTVRVPVKSEFAVFVVVKGG